MWSVCLGLVSAVCWLSSDYDAMIVFRMISWLYFLMSFLLSVGWSCICLHIPFIAYHWFIIRAHVDDNILEFSGLLISLFTLDMLCWIISLMVLLWCLCCLVLVVSWIWVGIRSSLILFVWYRSTLGSLLFINVSFPSLLPVRCSLPFCGHFNVDMVDDCYVCDDVWPVC